MTEWKEVTLASVSDQVNYGYTASAMDDPRLPRFLRITDIVGPHIDWSEVPGCAIDSNKLAKFAIQEDDIVVARTGATVGHAKRIRQHPESVFASYLVRFRPSPDVDPAYVGAVIESQAYKDWVLRHAGGAAQPNANAKVLGAYPFLLPDRPIQVIIGRILDTLDDLIENNRRRIELLEQMAQVIYREWFVHFRYPGHEDALPVDSPLGSMPEGWEVITIGDRFKVDKGLSYKGSYLTGSGTSMANLKCFQPSGGYRRNGTKPYSGPFKPKHGVAPGDLIIANTDLTQAGMVIGSPAFVPRHGFESGGLISHHVFAIRNADPATRQLLYEVLRDGAFRDYARGVASGTTVLGFRPADLLSYQLAWPPVALVQRFGELAISLRRAGEELSDAAEALSSIRDMLLPRLVTGQIDVSRLDLDALVEAVG
jgi:type I restriction enzyme, S subunit